MPPHSNLLDSIKAKHDHTDEKRISNSVFKTISINTTATINTLTTQTNFNQTQTDSLNRSAPSPQISNLITNTTPPTPTPNSGIPLLSSSNIASFNFENFIQNLNHNSNSNTSNSLLDDDEHFEDHLNMDDMIQQCDMYESLIENSFNQQLLSQKPQQSGLGNAKNQANSFKKH